MPGDKSSRKSCFMCSAHALFGLIYGAYDSPRKLASLYGQRCNATKMEKAMPFYL